VLLGRAEESAVIDQLLANARSGSSGTIVIKGEAGIGKSTLLDYAAHHASGMRVLRISGVESEAEIAFGALHLLLHEHLALIDSLPDVQAAALRAALGEAPARAEDRLLIGLALLTLLSDLAAADAVGGVARRRPVVRPAVHQRAVIRRPPARPRGHRDDLRRT
jgi:predicted ATP-dependent serine protease